MDGDRESVAEASVGGLRECSFKNARNSWGAISGCRLAGTQKRLSGSSAADAAPSELPLWDVLEDSSL